MEYKRLTNEELNDFTSRVVVQLEPTLTQQVISLILELSEYRTKIENGTLIELPCKVGSTVYVISKKALKGHWEEHRYIVDKWGKLAVYEKEFNLVLFSVSKVGKDYFLTKAEAEARLREIQGEK